VKSPPELWAEISDVEALGGHLGAFGEIRITRLEPETTVAWEGDRARGTVELEPSGWGTKVTLTARIAPEPPRDPEPAAAPEPEGAEHAAVAGEAEPAVEPEAAVEAKAAAESEAAVDPEPLVDPEPEVAVESQPVVEPEPEAAVEPQPVVEPEPEPARRRGFFARLFGRRRAARLAVDRVEESSVEPRTEAALDAAPEPAREAAAVTRLRVAAAEPEPAREADATAGPDATAGHGAGTESPAAAEPRAAAKPPSEPAPAADLPNENEPGPLDADRAEAILVGVLDDLGAAHHRPFSRG
jgi:hypothetical protein